MNVKASPRRIMAYAAVYLFWGGSFLAIRYVVHVIPPFLAAAVRYSLSGPILLLLSFGVRKESRPTRRQILNCLVTGLITFSFGYAIVFWAETRIASWMVAVLTATTFLWTYLGECLLLGASRISKAVLLPLLVGLLGIPLMLGVNLQKGKMWSLAAMLAVVLGAIITSGGALLIKRLNMPSSFLQTAGFQLVSAGTSLLVFSGSIGEWKHIPPVLQICNYHFFFGMAYLVLCGSVIAFSAYQWLLKHDKATLVATLTYIKPIIAMLIGIVFSHEQRSSLQIVGALILLGSVAAVWNAQVKSTRQALLLPVAEFSADLQLAV